MSRSLDLAKTPQSALFKPIEACQTLTKSDSIASPEISGLDKASIERLVELPVGQANFTHYLKMQSSHRYKPVQVRERKRKRMDLNLKTITID